MNSVTPGPRILVVDDNDDNRYTLTLYLELEGYADIQIAEDGEQAIARLDKESFDVVLLDVMMPKRLSGAELAEGQRRLHDVPVIMISALNEMSSVVRCITCGAVHGAYEKPHARGHLADARTGGSRRFTCGHHRTGQSRAVPEQQRYDVRDAVLRHAGAGYRGGPLLQCWPQSAVSR